MKGLKYFFAWIFLAVLFASFTQPTVLAASNIGYVNQTADVSSLNSRLIWKYKVRHPDKVAMSSDGEYIALISGDGVFLFSREKRKIWSYRATEGLRAIAISSDGKYIVVGSDWGVYLFSSDSEKPILTYRTDKVVGVDISYSGEFFASNDVEGNIYFFSVRDRRLLWIVNIGSAGVGAGCHPISIMLNEKYVVVGGVNAFYVLSINGTLVWKGATEDWVASVSSNDSAIVVSDYAGNIIFSTLENRSIWSYKTENGNDLYSVSLSKNGKYIVGGGWNSLVYTLSNAGDLLWSWKIGFPIYSTDISFNGSYIAVGGFDGYVYLFSISGELKWNYRAGGRINSVSISGEGNYVVATSSNGYIYLLNSTMEKERRIPSLYISPLNLTIDGGSVLRLVATLSYHEIPLANKKIVLYVSKGMLSDNIVYTNDSGKAVFTYYAPNVLSNTLLTVKLFFPGDDEYKALRVSLSEEIKPAVSLHVSKSISISCNNDFMEIGAKGKGIKDSPYVIENLTIYSSSDYGIKIENTNAFFIIKRLYIAGNLSTHFGILFHNVTNGEIFDVYLDMNGMGFGMGIYDSSNIVVSSSKIFHAERGISILKSGLVTLDKNIVFDINDIGIEVIESTDIIVDSNTVSYCSKHGIGFYFTNSSVIKENTAFYNGWYGISLRGSTGRFGIYSPHNADNNIVIKNNVFLNGLGPWGGGGILVKSNSNNNKIIMNNIDGNDGIGISLSDFTRNDIVEKNEISNNTGVGVDLTNSAVNITVINNIVKNNLISVWIRPSENNPLVHQSNLTKVINNTILNSKENNIMIWYSNYILIYKNKIENASESGILIRNSSYIDIYNNIISNNHYGISFDGETFRDEIHYNDIFNNSNGGLCSGYYINATLNWWGDKSGPFEHANNPMGLGNSVCDTIEFKPWLTIPYENIELTLTIKSSSKKYISGIIVVTPNITGYKVDRIEYYVDKNLINTVYTPPYSWIWNTRRYSDGPHTITGVAYDKYNISIQYSIVVYLDNTPPKIMNLTQYPTQPLENMSITVKLIANDSGSGVENTVLHYRVDGGDWVDILMKVEDGVWSGDIPGENGGSVVEYYVTVYDKAGNNINSSIYKFTVKTLPEFKIPLHVSITSPSENTTLNMNNVSVSWSIEVGTYNISKVFIKLDSGSWVDVTGLYKYMFTNLSNGKHIVTLKAVDEAGNTIIKTITFYIQITQPTKPAPTKPGIPIEYIAITIIAVIAIIAAVVIMRRRR